MGRTSASGESNAPPFWTRREHADRRAPERRVVRVDRLHDLDDPLTLGLGNDAIWKRFWEAVGNPAMGTDSRYATNVDRRAARALLGRVYEQCNLRQSGNKARW